MAQTVMSGMSSPWQESVVQSFCRRYERPPRLRMGGRDPALAAAGPGAVGSKGGAGGGGGYRRRHGSVSAAMGARRSSVGMGGAGDWPPAPSPRAAPTEGDVVLERGSSNQCGGSPGGASGRHVAVALHRWRR